MSCPDNPNDERMIRGEKFIPLMIILCGIFAYANSFLGVFVFSDHLRILQNPDLRHWKTAIRFSTRPLVNLTFYWNYVIGGFYATDYHLVNFLFLLVGALFLFGLIRRTLLLPFFEGHYETKASGLAGAISCLWIVHPLLTESVTYIVQRAESMMGMFYLATLLFFVRSVASGKPKVWQAGAVLACILGMVSKPIMVTAPLVVLLYDRAFVSGSVGDAWRARRGMYLGLAATWLVPVLLVSLPHESASSAGFSAKIASPLEYLMTQPGVILHYLKLAFWPVDLCLDYGWPYVLDGREIIWPAVAVGSLILLTLWGTDKRHPAGFLGLWFFLILVPSSSFIPLADFAAEHRMYLPVAGVITAVVLAGYWFSEELIRRAGRRASMCRLIRSLFLVVLLGGLLGLTIRRNAVYRSTESMFRDVVEKRPGNYRAWIGVITGLLEKEDFAQAEDAARRLVNRITEELNAGTNPYLSGPISAYHHYPFALSYLGRSLLGLGRMEEAQAAFVAALQAKPGRKEDHHNLALALYLADKVEEAMAQWQEALRLDPKYANARSMLGVAYAARGQYEKAVEELRAALAVDPNSSFIQSELAWILAACPVPSVRNAEQAISLARSLCETTQGQSPRGFDILAAAYAENGQFAEARDMTRRALDLLDAGGAVAARSPSVGGGAGEGRQESTGFRMEVEARLRLYEQAKPYRFPMRGPGGENVE